MVRRRRKLPVRRNIDLLATVQESGNEQVRTRKVFGNIIELGSQGLVLETSNQIPVGATVVVRVVFPGQPRGNDPFARLRCSVRELRDELQMHYDLSIVDMDEPTRERLEIYLSQSTTSWGI